ncbi:terminal uridylyltransferase 4-like isoform X2 [Montipora capricornis]|uniref:terminal uridylyltransferase 4-like isoform X2 n=1 Tax=Montipora capricornis TaxID=246305 RepID=UPI0035F10098
MKNSEVSEPSSENSDDLKTENSRGNTRGDTSHTKRTKQASKEKRREVHKAVTDDQTCEEEYAKILKNLESQHFVVSSDKLEDPSKSEGAPFYCELCSMKIENVQECPNHVITKAHKKAKKAKGEYLTLCRVKSPSQSQISALNRLLEAVFHEHGLCPVKGLPIRQEVAKDVSKTIHVLHPECAVSVFGSSLTGFGLKDSDINLDLVIPDQGNVPHILLSILDLLQKNESYSDVKSDFDAKVPRILFKHVSSGLDCELSPGNFTASKTSQLLKTYYELDPRVRLLAVGLRYWARVCSIDCQSDGGLPGYSLALMVIQFLQEIKPPVLPRWIPSEIIDDNSEKVPQDFVSSNKDVTGNLWFQLFRFYCIDFDIPTLVISIKEPVPVKRKDRNWGQRRIAVEDPFSTKRNVASSLSSDKVWDYFFTCWKNSFFYWASLPSNSPTKSLSEVPSVEANTFTKNKTNNKELKVNNRERELENREDGIFEMDDLDNTTKQVHVESMEICDVDSAQKEISSQEQGKKNFDQNDTGEDIEITLSESESEKQPGILGDAGGAFDLREKNSLVRYKDRTNITAEQEVEYRFDAQVFRGNSRPIKTCCYCKEDGHVKENCPDLRKPSLKKLPPMTAGFGDLLDYVCKTCRADFEFDKAEVAYRERVLKNLEGYIHEIFPDARLSLFGSSKNGFGFRNSDIDICMTLENHVREEVDAVDVITKLARLLKKHKDCGSVLAITTAKVPIVKFYLRSCKREADISLYNTLALENTDMLATYAKLDERVATLGYTVKVFAKVCDIGDASKGSLSSYAYILMLLHYLQQCQPPVIPVLQSLHTEEKRPEKIVDDWNCWFCSDLNKINSLWKPKERNRMSAGLLWIDFLKYYTEVFDFEHDVVCCRGTKKLTKFEKMWTKHVFAIEDPFNLDHNLGAGVTRKMATYIMTAFIKGRERFGFPRYDIPIAFAQQYFFDVYFLTDGYEAPNDRNCRVCGKIGHIAKDCPRSKSNKRAERLKEEEEERKARQVEPTETPVLSSKPFSAGPSRERSASTPPRQGQDNNTVNRTPQPTGQQSTNVPPLPQAGVNDISSSEPGPQFVPSPLKGEQSSAGMSANSTGEQFINLVKVAEEEYKKTENAQMSLEEDEPEELEHLGPKDPKLAETPEEHQLLSKLSQVKSLWEEGASPEMEDALQITSADSEDATLEQKGALVHPDNKPDDQLPVRREAWFGPDKDSEFKAVCAEEKEDVSGGIQTIVSKSIKGNDGVASIEHQKCDPSFATRSTDVDEKLTGILVGKEEQHESSTTESTAAKTEMPEEPVKQKQPRRGGRARKNKSSKNGNNSASPGEKCPGDFPRKEKQKNYSDFEGSGGGIQTSVSKSIKGNDGVASIEHQKCDPSLAARRTDVVDEKLTGMLRGKEEQRESSTTESTAAKTGMPEEPVKQKQTRRGEQASKNKSSKNGSNSERPEEKSPSDFPRKEKQKSYSDFDGSKNQSTLGKSEEKTSGESPKKGKDKQLWHRNSYDDLKSPRGESAPRKLGKTPPKKKISQQREHQKGFDDFKGSKYECGPKKPDVKSAGGGPKKGDDPQLRHQENYALKAEALKDSREGKKPRAELQERVKGEPQSAERVTGSKAPSLPKNQGTSPRSNAEDKKNPAGNNQAGGPRSSGNSPGVSNKGGRRRRPHLSSNQRWEPASEGGDSRKVNNSTQEERSPKRN